MVRLVKNATFRRATPPAYGGRGRPPTRGTLVRPLPRTYRDQVLPATPPDRVATWREDSLLLRAAVWTDLRRSDADADRHTFAVFASHDPR